MIEYLLEKIGDYVLSMLNILNFSIVRIASAFSSLDNMFEDLIELLQKVSEGNEEEIQRGGLEDSKIGAPETAKLSALSVQGDHYRACVVQTSAEILGMKTTAFICKEYMSMLNVLSEKFHHVRLKEITLAPEDYADTIIQMVQEINDNMVPLHGAFSTQQKDQADTSKPDESLSIDDAEPGSSNPKSTTNIGNKSPRESSSEPSIEGTEQINIQVQLRTSKSSGQNKRQRASLNEAGNSSPTSKSPKKKKLEAEKGKPNTTPNGSAHYAL